MKPSFGAALVLSVMVCSQQAEAAPIIRSQPKALTVNAGSTASLTVVATNAGPITYQWQFKTVNLPGETNSTLLIENVATNQAGAYRAVVRAESGSVTSSIAALTVVQGTIVRFQIAGSNVDVELFDRDKPATVQNFLHYVKAGIYTNTFFHRLVPGFCLQGGGYGVSNRAASDFVITNVYDLYQMGQSRTSDPLAPYVAGEFGVGPRIRNTFGTLAMARIADPSTDGGMYPNSANSQWFFNLADNSTNLDNVSGGFTVFGRVIRGEETLASFNNLSMGQGIIDLTSYWPTNDGSIFQTLPYQGSGFPRYSELFYANIQVQGKFALDTTPPSMAVVFPPEKALLTNGAFTFRGTARDNTGVGLVDCWLYRYTPTMTYLSSVSLTGLTNWSSDVNLEPGTYLGVFRVWDGYGKLRGVLRNFTISAPLSVQVQGAGKVNRPLSGQYLEIWKQYSVTATPNAGQLFATWSGTGTTTRQSKLTFTMTTNLVLTATFVSNNFPRIQGTYNGLFYDTNGIVPASAGFFTLKTTGTGSYSGKMLLAGKTVSLSGAFDYTGVSRTTLKVTGMTNPVQLALAIDLTNNTGIISGILSNSVWKSTLLGFRGVSKLSTNSWPAPGKYVLTIPGAPGATTNGVATLTAASTGILAVSGKLSDKTTISESVVVSKEGYWPVFASLYGGKGLLFGWETFNTNTCQGILTWIKPALGATNGFSIDVNALGVPYVAPHK